MYKENEDKCTYWMSYLIFHCFIRNIYVKPEAISFIMASLEMVKISICKFSTCNILLLELTLAKAKRKPLPNCRTIFIFANE